jgi:hypothetical protein
VPFKAQQSDVLAMLAACPFHAASKFSQRRETAWCAAVVAMGHQVAIRFNSARLARLRTTIGVIAQTADVTQDI